MTPHIETASAAKAQNYWTFSSFCTIIGCILPHLYLPQTDRRLPVRSPSTQVGGLCRLQSSTKEEKLLPLRTCARTKGLVALSHACRPRKVPCLSGRAQSRCGTAGGSYPQPVGRHGELCRPGFRAASGAATPGPRARRRFTCESASGKLDSNTDIRAGSRDTPAPERQDP